MQEVSVLPPVNLFRIFLDDAFPIVYVVVEKEVFGFFGEKRDSLGAVVDVIRKRTVRKDSRETLG